MPNGQKKMVFIYKWLFITAHLRKGKYLNKREYKVFIK